MRLKLLNIHSHINFPEEHVLIQANRAVPNVSDMISAGIHPVIDAENAFLILEDLPHELQLENVIAIGESGFDKNSPLTIEEQLQLFRQQMILSEQSKLPIIIHCVGRWNELEQVFKEKKAGSPVWIIHGFRKMKITEKFLGLGAYLSFGEAVLYDETVQKALKDIPLDRIFLETDDKEFDIRLIYQKLAETKGLVIDEAALQIHRNFEKAFGFELL